MSLLGRIAEQQGATKQEDTARRVGAEEEAAKPNAVDDANNQRGGYSNAVVDAPDQEIQDEMPEPQEQEAFTVAERQLAEIVYGPQASDSIIKACTGSQDPVAGVGKMAAEAVRATLDKIDVELTEDAQFSLGESAVEQIVEVLESSNPEINLNDDQMAEALSIGVGHWATDNPDKMGAKEEYLNGDAPEQLAPQQQPQEQPQQPPIQGV